MLNGSVTNVIPVTILLLQTSFQFATEQDKFSQVTKPRNEYDAY